MTTSLLALTAVLALTGPESDTGSAIITKCRVSLKYECKVAAQEPGQLKKIHIQEGDFVKEGELLAQINDSKAQAAKYVAEKEHEVAKAEAANDVNIQYAKAQRDVTEATYQTFREANRQREGVVVKTEMLKYKLDARRGELGVDQEDHKHKVDVLTADAKQAAVTAAKDDVDRRRIEAPIEGQIVELFQKDGQWVNPGDPLAHIVQLNVLRVDGLVKKQLFAPEDVFGRDVTLRILVKGGQETFKGKIVHIPPELNTIGEYRVIAEVQNKEVERGGHKFWLLWPGDLGDMTIEVEPQAGTAQN